MILKKGDRCIVKAIGKADAWFSDRKHIVGKEVVFSLYDVCDPGQTFDGGFVQCEIEPLALPGGKTAYCFHRIKLRKIN